jgi:chorismate-pyruvate lyase
MTRGAGPPAGDAVARACELVGLFCPSIPSFGSIECVEAGAVPEPARQLLHHRSHMTVAMERHHACAVELRVVAERHHAGGGSDAYAREILLVRPDGAVVQYGIVRIDLQALDRETAAAIRGHAAPLGRILVAAGLFCEVQQVALLRIEAGPHLRRLVGACDRVYGRVAAIAVDGSPTIELLEIVVPAAAPPSS